MLKNDRIVHLLALLPLVTGGLYFFGITFHQGYLRTLGVEESLFPLTVDRSLFQGSIAVLTMGLVGGFYALLAAELIYIGSDLFIFAASRRRTHIPLTRSIGNGETPPKDTDKKPHTTTFHSVATRMLGFSGLFITAILIFLLAGYFADSSGKRTAKRFMEDVTNQKLDKDQIWIRNETQPLVGTLILCSTVHCAYRTSNESIVINISDIKSIKHQTPSSQ